MKDEKTRKEVRNEGNQEGRQECIRGRNFRGKGEHAAEKKKMEEIKERRSARQE